MGKISFEGLSIGEKFDVILNQFESIQKRLDKIKPECFLIEEKSTEPITPREPLGDFWVCLKDAKEYKWHEYSYEDFVMGIWCINPNNSHYSGSTNDRAVGFPAIDSDVIPDHPKQWSFGASEEEHEWFTEENIKEGLIWVKPLMVHADDDDEDEDDD